MERDFLGINGKEAKEEERVSGHDSGFATGSAMQWPFSNKISALQQFMSYKAACEERPKKNAFDQFNTSGYQPASNMDSFEAKPNVGFAPQKTYQFTMHSYHTSTADSFGAAKHQAYENKSCPVVSHHSFPVVTASPFFKVHGAPNCSNLTTNSLKQQPFVGSTVGTFAARNLSKPLNTMAQLTIFYGGVVNVYDNVPLDKAQAIMTLASKGCGVGSNAGNLKPEAPVLSPVKVAVVEGMSTNPNQNKIPNQNALPGSGLSSPLSVTSHTGPHSGSSSTAIDDVPGTKAAATVAPVSQSETHKTIKSTTLAPTATVPVMPRAVPQARKASLARFLEKRKERVSNAMPYACTKKNPDGNTAFEDNSLCSQTSAPDIALSSNMEQSWHLKNPTITNIGESPNTKLEI